MQEQAHVVMAKLCKGLVGALRAAVGQLLALPDSEMADLAQPDVPGDQEGNEAYGAQAALLRAYHLLLVAQPSSNADLKAISQQADLVLQVSRKQHPNGFAQYFRHHCRACLAMQEPVVTQLAASANS